MLKRGRADKSGGSLEARASQGGGSSKARRAREICQKTAEEEIKNHTSDCASSESVRPSLEELGD